MANSIDYGMQDLVTIHYKDDNKTHDVIDDIYVVLTDKFLILMERSSEGTVRRFINSDEIKSFKLTKLKKDN